MEDLQLKEAKVLVEKAKKEKLESSSIKLKQFLEEENITLRVENKLNGNILESYIVLEVV
jgi:hypothetical protein